MDVASKYLEIMITWLPNGKFFDLTIHRCSSKFSLSKMYQWTDDGIPFSKANKTRTLVRPFIVTAVSLWSLAVFSVLRMWHAYTRYRHVSHRDFITMTIGCRNRWLAGKKAKFTEHF